MLLTPPSVLSKYDVPEHVLEILRRSSVNHVSIFARRGPLEVAFTAKELREMMNIVGTAMKPIPQELLTPPPGTEVTRQQGRILDILKKGSKEKYGFTEKTWSIDFFRSPTSLSWTENGGDLPLKLTLNHTTLDSTTHVPVSAGITSEHNTSLVVTSLGFHADPSSTPFYDPEVKRLRTLPGGRLIKGSNGRLIKNVYGSGWAAGGAKGVLASTMIDAYTVAETIVEDLMSPCGPTDLAAEDMRAGGGGDEKNPLEIMNTSPSMHSLPPEIVHGLWERQIVQFRDWKQVDEEEIRRGQESGKERERMGWEQVKTYLGLASVSQ